MIGIDLIGLFMCAFVAGWLYASIAAKKQPPKPFDWQDYPEWSTDHKAWDDLARRDRKHGR